MELFHILSLSLAPPLSLSLFAFSPVKHFSIKRLWTIFFCQPWRGGARGWGVGVRGVFYYIILLPEKFWLSPGLWDSLSHIISIAASTGKLTYLQSLQPNNPTTFWLLPSDMETQQRHGPHSLCHTCRRTESSRMKVTRGYKNSCTVSGCAVRVF